jgi:maleate isomerase
MERRQFIILAGAAAIEAPALTLRVLSQSEGLRWQPDGGGSIARIGVLTPDFDPVPESEMWTMAQHGVSVHVSRVVWNRHPEWDRDARVFGEPPNVDNATKQLAAVKPQVIVYAFSSSSYVLGTEGDDALRTRLEKTAGDVPVILTCPAATEALHSLGVHRIALIHPPWFKNELTAAGMNYFRKQGFEVVLSVAMTPPRSFTEVPAAEVYEWATKNVPRQAEALFIAGNGLRAIGAIQALEESLARPVLTANQVAFWGALQLAHVNAKPNLYGRIFSIGRREISRIAGG